MDLYQVIITLRFRGEIPQEIEPRNFQEDNRGRIQNYVQGYFDEIQARLQWQPSTLGNYLGSASMAYIAMALFEEAPPHIRTIYISSAAVTGIAAIACSLKIHIF